MPHRILLVEDELGLVLTLTDRLRAEGFQVEDAQDGDAGLSRAMNESFDLVILDVMLPGKSGFDVCRELRQAAIGVPILMLTARGEVIDKVVGLQLGADDYLTKPFDMMELLARIAALLRRAPAAQRGSGTVEFGDVRVDFRRAEITRKGRPVDVSAREFQLLAYLTERRGETVSRDELLREVWGYSYASGTRTVDVHMAWLRQKLEENPRHPEYLLTVRGFGYRFAG